MIKYNSIEVDGEEVMDSMNEFLKLFSDETDFLHKQKNITTFCALVLCFTIDFLSKHDKLLVYNIMESFAKADQKGISIKEQMNITNASVMH